MTTLLLLTDIFGNCDGLKQLTMQLSKKCELSVLDPYQGREYGFNNEQEAYQHFISHCGHDAYFALAKQKVAQIQPDYIIGFSAGGSVVWRLAAQQLAGNCKGLMSFYPSQIRNHLTLTANTPITVVFPQTECTFSVQKVAKVMSDRKNVSVITTSYNHGFMNQQSNSHDINAYQLGFSLIKSNCLL